MPKEEPDCSLAGIPVAATLVQFNRRADLFQAPAYVSACTEGIFLTTQDLRGYLDGSESRKANGVSRLGFAPRTTSPAFGFTSRV